MFEPIHGSAPELAGLNVSDPLATVWSASQMLDFFGHEEWGKRLLDAIEKLLSEGKVLTPDLGGNSSTQDVGDEIVRILREMV